MRNKKIIDLKLKVSIKNGEKEYTVSSKDTVYIVSSDYKDAREVFEMYLEGVY